MTHIRLSGISQKLTDLGKVEADGALWRLVELALEVVQEPRLQKYPGKQ